MKQLGDDLDLARDGRPRIRPVTRCLSGSQRSKSGKLGKRGRRRWTKHQEVCRHGQAPHGSFDQTRRATSSMHA